MIDVNTGYLKIEGTTISGLMELKDFMVQSLFSKCKIERENDGWKVYGVADFYFNDYLIKATLYFYENKLTNISLAIANKGITSSWDDVTEETLSREKELHDTLLQELIGQKSRADYSWGYICSYRDDRAANSSIIIRYH